MVPKRRELLLLDSHLKEMIARKLEAIKGGVVATNMVLEKEIETNNQILRKIREVIEIIDACSMPEWDDKDKHPKRN